MKRLLFFILLFIGLTTVKAQEQIPNELWGIKFGFKIEEVKTIMQEKFEATLKSVDDLYDIYTYEVKGLEFVGKPFQELRFKFCFGELYNIDIIYYSPTPSQIFSLYNATKSNLISTYGMPEKDRAIIVDSSFLKNDDSKILAIKSGYIMFNAYWQKKPISIMNEIARDVTVHISFEDVSMAEKKEMEVSAKTRTLL